MNELTNAEKQKLLTHKQLLDVLRQNRDEQVDGWKLIKSMLSELGGEEMMGREIAKLYRGAPDGSPAQRAMMQMMTTLMKTFGERPVKENPLGNLDEGELKRLLVDVLRESGLVLGDEDATEKEGQA